MVPYAYLTTLAVVVGDIMDRQQHEQEKRENSNYYSQSQKLLSVWVCLVRLLQHTLWNVRTVRTDEHTGSSAMWPVRPALPTLSIDLFTFYIFCFIFFFFFFLLSLPFFFACFCERERGRERREREESRERERERVPSVSIGGRNGKEKRKKKDSTHQIVRRTQAEADRRQESTPPHPRPAHTH